MNKKERLIEIKTEKLDTAAKKITITKPKHTDEKKCKM